MEVMGNLRVSGDYVGHEGVLETRRNFEGHEKLWRSWGTLRVVGDCGGHEGVWRSRGLVEVMRNVGVHGGLWRVMGEFGDQGEFWRS